MRRQARYWLPFSIVAIGLVLSWGQVGRKAERALTASPVTYLTVEPGCAPTRAPCAALAGDHALVLGPDDAGLRLRQTGLDPADIIRVEARLMAPDGTLLTQRRLAADADGWRLPDLGDSDGRLRVRVIANRAVSVADYPLRAR